MAAPVECTPPALLSAPSAEALPTPTPSQLAELVRELADQLRQLTGPARHPARLGRSIPAAMALRLLLLTQADAMLAAMETSTPGDAATADIARKDYSQDEGVIRIDDFPAVAYDDTESGDVWVAAWVRVFADEIAATTAGAVLDAT